MNKFVISPKVPAIGMALVLASAAWAASSAERVTYLGVAVARVDDTLRTQLNLTKGAGLKVEEVEAKSPAEKAGLKRYDVLEKLNDQVLFNPDQLANLVLSFEPGAKVTLSLVREGHARTVEATLGEHEAPKPDAPATRGPAGWQNLWPFHNQPYEFKPFEYKPFEFQYQELLPEAGSPRGSSRGLAIAPPARKTGESASFLGVELQPVEASLAAQLNLNDGHGALVGHVVEQSPAEQAGLKAHDVLVKVDGEEIESPNQFVKQIQAHKPGDKVRLSVIRRGQPLEVEVRLSRKANPEPRQVEKLIRQYRVVPHIEIRQDPSQKGGRIVVLKGAEAGATGEARDVNLQSRQSRTSAASATSSEVIVIKSDQGAITIRGKDGRRAATVQDPQGEIVFEGPIDSEQERARLSPEVRRRIEEATAKMKSQPKPTGAIKELKLLNSRSKANFIRQEIQVLPVAAGTRL